MTDAVSGIEFALATLHTETFGVIGEVRATGVQDRVVITAAQFKCHFTCDGAPDPALQALPQHQTLRIEPATLIQQTAQLAAHGPVIVEGAFIVNGIGEAFVSAK